MMVYETGDMLFGKVDIENVKIYEAIMVLLTKIKEDLVLRTVPRFPSRMVMVGVLFQLRGNLMYLLMMHKEEDRPDQGGVSNPTRNTPALRFRLPSSVDAD